MQDPFNELERALERLLERLGTDHIRYSEGQTYQHRLRENIAEARRFGDTSELKHNRARIVDSLNRLSLKTTGVGFLDPAISPLYGERSSPQRPARLFPFLSSFETDDAEFFFGREREIRRLVTAIERDPVVVVNGLSGCGKSSLMKAGVIPQLRASGYYTVYVPVFENVVEDMRQEVRRLLSGADVPEGCVSVLDQLYRECRRHVVLVVDQFERALVPSHSSQALEQFLGSIPRLTSRANRTVTVVIVVRADWLYFLDTSIREFHPRLNIHSCIFTVDPLTSQSAREAIIMPLEMRDYPYDPTAVGEIVDSLKSSYTGPSVGAFVQPIQLQIVLRALFESAERRGVPRIALTRENYQALGGAENILRTYLVNSLGKRSEAWRLLARFVAQDEKSGRTLHRSELLSVPAGEDVALELRYLVDQGFIEAYEAEDPGETYYRLAHDYLVDEIVAYLSRNPDQQGWKLAEDWLANGTYEWQASERLDGGSDFLLERNRYLHIYQYRDKLKLTEDSQRLLVLTAIRYGHEGVGYWISRGPESIENSELLKEHLLSSEVDTRRSAREALAESVKGPQEASAFLDEEEGKILTKNLREAMASPSDPSKPGAAARALWTLKSFDSLGERLCVGGTVFRLWLGDHSLQIFSYVATVFLALSMLLGVLYGRSRLRGSWQLIQSLKAGVVSQVIVDPTDLNRVYAIVRGGPEPYEGCTLLVNRGEDWEYLSRDIASQKPTSLAVNSNRMYMTFYGGGVLRSEDGGRTWEIANTGLSSRGLTSLAINPEDPSTLYVGTDDWRGVFISRDGADSWDYYDYQGEILGTMITELAYSAANGGTLVAGTVDGRILIHRQDADRWELRSRLSQGAISVLAVAEAGEDYIYAGTTSGRILRSTDGGATWENLGKPGYVFKISSIAIVPDTPTELYVSAKGYGGATVWRSEDGGGNWEMVDGVGLPRSRVGALVIDHQTPYQLVAGTADGLFTSSDKGKTWVREPISAPLAAVREVGLSSGSATPIYAVVGASVFVNDGSIYTSPEDSEHNWSYGLGLRSQRVRDIVVDPVNSHIAYAGVFLLGEWSVFKTSDGGLTWRQTNPPSIEPIPSDTLSLALGRGDNGDTVVYAGTMGCGVFRSVDGGKSWDTYGRGQCSEAKGMMPSEVSFLATGANDPSVVYAASDRQFYSSSDGGNTWQEYELDAESPIEGLASDPIETDFVYVITRSDGLWFSENRGVTWHRQGDESFETAALSAIASIPEQSGHLVVSASNGNIWTTSNGGRTWQLIRENLTINNIRSIATSQGLEGKLLISNPADGIALYVPGHLLASDP